MKFLALNHFISLGIAELWHLSVYIHISFLGYHDLIFQPSFLFQNLVNELIKNFIIFHEDIFKGRVAGTVYEKYLTPEPEEVLGDSPLDANNPEFIDSEVGEDGKALFIIQFLILWHYILQSRDSMFFFLQMPRTLCSQKMRKRRTKTCRLSCLEVSVLILIGHTPCAYQKKMFQGKKPKFLGQYWKS